jgi:hypothetical protein
MARSVWSLRVKQTALMISPAKNETPRPRSRPTQRQPPPAKAEKQANSEVTSAGRGLVEFPPAADAIVGLLRWPAHPISLSAIEPPSDPFVQQFPSIPWSIATRGLRRLVQNALVVVQIATITVRELRRTCHSIAANCNGAPRRFEVGRARRKRPFPETQALPVNIPSTQYRMLGESCWTSHWSAVPAYVDKHHYIVI